MQTDLEHSALALLSKLRAHALSPQMLGCSDCRAMMVPLKVWPQLSLRWANKSSISFRGDEPGAEADMGRVQCPSPPPPPGR